MPRSSPKLPFAIAGKERCSVVITEEDEKQTNRVNFTEEAWQRLESALGTPLLPDVRTAIVSATREYLDKEVFERTRERFADARKIVEQRKKSAREFRPTLRSPGSAAGIFADGLIKSNFHDARLGEAAEAFEALAGALTSVDLACCAALAALKELENSEAELEEGEPKNSDAAYFTKGKAWPRWTLKLRDIMRDASLPHGASKGRPSRFNDFLWELQKLLPRECRRFSQSAEGQVKAVLQARVWSRPQAAKARAAHMGTGRLARRG